MSIDLALVLVLPLFALLFGVAVGALATALYYERHKHDPLTAYLDISQPTNEK